MNLIFFGSANVSTIVLQKLIDYSLSTSHFALIAVVSTPDKPVGRGLKLTPNPVKVLAQKNNIRIIEKLSELNVILNKVKDPVGLIAAYGRIIKPEILGKFSGRLYNIHPSLLPKYRGPSPLQNQILDNVSKTGVTIIQLDEQMDHGPIVAQQNDILFDTDTTETLGTRLFDLGTDLFLKTSPLLFPSPKSGEGSGVRLVPQNDNLATYTKLLTRQDGFIPYDLFTNLLTTHNPQLTIKFRAYYPWPGIWSTTPEGKRIKLITLKPKIMIQIEGQKPQFFRP